MYLNKDKGIGMEVLSEENENEEDNNHDKW